MVLNIILFCLQQLDINMLLDVSPDLSPDSASEVASPTEDKGESLVLSPSSASMPVSCPVLTCKTGLFKRPPGFQPTVCCITSSAGSEVIPLSNLAVSSEFGV